jgi:hypothetical protein
MDILAHNLEKDKRPQTQMAVSTKQKKEDFNHPVGKHCVRSLYSGNNKNEALRLFNLSVDKVMKEHHLHEIKERKSKLEEDWASKVLNNYLETD